MKKSFQDFNVDPELLTILVAEANAENRSVSSLLNKYLKNHYVSQGRYPDSEKQVLGDKEDDLNSI